MKHLDGIPGVPDARLEDQVDHHHGIEIPDPYRWLEDPDSAESRSWISAQNRRTFAFLEQIPRRDAIRERLTGLWNFERSSAPWKRAGRYFYTRNDGLQNQDVLFTMTSPEAPPEVLLDPNRLSDDGTVAVGFYIPSQDGKLVAYGYSAAGSDWTEIRVRETDTGRDRSDHLKWVKFSGAAWDHEARGFFYSRYDEPGPDTLLEEANYHQKLYYHRLGTAQEEDVLIYERPDQKEWGFGGQVTEDGRYLVIHVWKGSGTRNLIFYKDLGRPDTPVLELIRDFEAEYVFVDNDGPVFWLRTDLLAPRGRLIAVDVRESGRERWRELIPTRPETLTRVDSAGDRLVAHYLRDAHSSLVLHDRNGSVLGEVALPGLGSVVSFEGRPGDSEAFYVFSGYASPGTVFRLDLDEGTSRIFHQPALRFNPDDFVTTQVFFSSKDGTRIPMFISHRRDLPRDGNRPAYLFGYGGFNLALTPTFAVEALHWMEMGGIFAVPNLRGGGEYGEEWHRQGCGLARQNVFDDFIAAGEWLIGQGYTKTPRLAIGGRSNGGLLVGACMTQRPDLFGAAVPMVGVLDMLRFHKFTIGWAWVSDYGSPENGEEFHALHRYSPLHNLKPGTAYPPTFIMTADHDDRVVPAHSFKFAAALQAAQGGPAPIFIRVDTRSGHGMGKPVAKLIEEVADRQAFLAWALEMEE